MRHGRSQQHNAPGLFFELARVSVSSGTSCQLEHPLSHSRLLSSDGELSSALPQGMLKGDDLSAAYASADIFVMPSESETLGFVALEVRESMDVPEHPP